ncbi:MAG: 2-oxoglutarate dehydrogenase complex dihydrolipoyllysine-residue succinyltransferase, partial [Alphaproteobacteria bacterium]|nr:2-oxoglutarate dehydrogenase complex dihydrolipoyllysine-residue succinyltransferase [Alphaproteobacteria bacterium]
TGILSEIKTPKGSFVKVGDIMAVIAVSETAAHRPPKPTSPGNQSVLADSITHSAYTDNHAKDDGYGVQLAAITPNTHASPSAKRAIAQSGVAPERIQGTGKDGMITKTDVQRYIQPTPTVDLPSTNPFTLKHGSYQEAVETRHEQRVPMSRLRARIAERLKEAQNTAAILTTFNEADLSALKDIRTKYKDPFEKTHGVKLGFMSFFVKAAIEALKKFPAVNAEIQGSEIIYKNYYDISIAVSTPQGLVVPVLRRADQLSLADIEKEIALLGKKASSNKLTIEDLTGGTFTISNGGVFGSMLSTPIINPPQSGILGMHAITDRPVAVNGRVEIRPMMYLALSYDHRIVDGREAVSFLVTIKECIENPGRFLLDI